MKQYLVTEKVLRENWNYTECSQEQWVEMHGKYELPPCAIPLTREQIDEAYKNAFIRMLKDVAGDYQGGEHRLRDYMKDELFGEEDK